MDELIRKGQITISEAKELNEELKKKLNGRAQEKEKHPDAPVTVRDLKEILAEMNLATKADLEAMGRRICEFLERKSS